MVPRIDISYFLRQSRSETPSKWNFPKDRKCAKFVAGYEMKIRVYEKSLGTPREKLIRESQYALLSASNLTVNNCHVNGLIPWAGIISLAQRGQAIYYASIFGSGYSISPIKKVCRSGKRLSFRTANTVMAVYRK